MKKLPMLLLAIFLVFAMVTLTACISIHFPEPNPDIGEEDTVDDTETGKDPEIVYTQGLVYTFVQNGYAVSGIGNVTSKNIVIPPSYNGQPVIQIGGTIGQPGAFENAAIETVVLPDTIRRIQGGAFIDCAQLSSINIPDGVEFIGSHAFSRCYSLTSLELPDSVLVIDALAFSSCTKLEKINIPNNLKRIEDATFYECTALKELTIPKSVEYIGRWAFYDCKNLKKINIEGFSLPDRHDDWKDGTNADVVFLETDPDAHKRLDFPKNLRIVEEDASLGLMRQADSFYLVWNKVQNASCYKTEYTGQDVFGITPPAQNYAVFKLPFGTKFRVLAMGDGVDYLDSAWSGWIEHAEADAPKATAGLQFKLINKGTEYEVSRGTADVYYSEVVIPSIHNGLLVTKIANDAFFQTNVKSVIIPEGITDIGTNAFAYTMLNKITLPDSLTIINIAAFCKSTLKSITIPKNVVTMGRYPLDRGYAGGGVFQGNVLESINVHPDNPVFKSEGNCIIRKETNSVFTGCKNSVIPEYIKSIEASAFEGVMVDTIKLPYGLFEIETSAFYLSGIKTITIPETVERIDSFAFSYCARLESIYIPASVTYMGFNFGSCPKLTIYTEHESAPSGWQVSAIDSWNRGDYPVVWGAEIA